MRKPCDIHSFCMTQHFQNGRGKDCFHYLSQSRLWFPGLLLTPPSWPLCCFPCLTMVSGQESESSLQKFITGWGCSSAAEVLGSHAGNLGFQPRHFIYQARWHLPVILARKKHRQRIQRSELCSTTQWAWGQSGLHENIFHKYPKNIIIIRDLKCQPNGHWAMWHFILRAFLWI